MVSRIKRGSRRCFAVALSVLMLLSAMSLVSFAVSGTAGPHDHQYNTEPDIAAVAPSCTTADVPS